jgi:hypothetical protein
MTGAILWPVSETEACRNGVERSAPSEVRMCSEVGQEFSGGVRQDSPSAGCGFERRQGYAGEHRRRAKFQSAAETKPGRETRYCVWLEDQSGCPFSGSLGKLPNREWGGSL